MEIYGQYKEMNKNAHILLFSIKRKQTKWNSLIQEIQIKGNTAEKNPITEYSLLRKFHGDGVKGLRLEMLRICVLLLQHLWCLGCVICSSLPQDDILICFQRNVDPRMRQALIPYFMILTFGRAVAIQLCTLCWLWTLSRWPWCQWAGCCGRTLGSRT